MITERICRKMRALSHQSRLFSSCFFFNPFRPVSRLVLFPFPCHLLVLPSHRGLTVQDGSASRADRVVQRAFAAIVLIVVVSKMQARQS